MNFQENVLIVCQVTASEVRPQEETHHGLLEVLYIPLSIILSMRD